MDTFDVLVQACQYPRISMSISVSGPLPPAPVSSATRWYLSDMNGLPPMVGV